MSTEVRPANGTGNSKKLWIFLSIAIYLNHLIYGINSNIIGPALVDLKFIYHTSIDQISYIYPALSIGFMLGSLGMSSRLLKDNFDTYLVVVVVATTVGWFYRWINRQLVFVIFITIHSVSTILVPHMGSLPPLLSVIVFYGIASSVWDSCFSTWLVEMWPQSNSAILQSSQSMYSIGTIVGPLLVSFYVYGELDNPSNNATARALPMPIIGNLSTLNITPEQRESFLSLPFALVGFLQSIGAICLFAAYIIQPYRKPSEEHGANNKDDGGDLSTTVRSIHAASPQTTTSAKRKAKRSQRQVDFYWPKVFLISICVASFNSCEVNYFYFSPTMFQYLDIRLSAAKSAHLLSTLSTTFAIGRVLSVFVSLHVIPDVMIAFHLTVVAVSQMLLYIYRDNELLIFVFTALLGYGFSAMWAGLFAFTERHIGLSERVGSVFCLLIGFLNLVAPMAISKYFHQTPVILFYVTWVFLSVSTICFLSVCVLILWSNRRRREAKARALDQVTCLNSRALMRLSSMASGGGGDLGTEIELEQRVAVGPIPDVAADADDVATTMAAKFFRAPV